VYAGQDIESGELLVVSQWKVKTPTPKRKGSHGEAADPELVNIVKQVYIFLLQIFQNLLMFCDFFKICEL